MRLAFSILFLLLTLSVSNIHAQDDTPAYRLRVPSAEEYLSAVPEIIENWEVSRSEHDAYYFPIEVMQNELVFRYPDTLILQDFALLNETYESLREYYRYLDRSFWNGNIVASWLNARHIDLANKSSLNFAEYGVTVTPYDFNADEVSEYVLDTKKLDGKYKGFIVVWRDNNGSYQVVPTPLTWLTDENRINYQLPYGGEQQILMFTDLNADLIPEWVIAQGYDSDDNLYVTNLFVLSWRDGVLVNLLDKRVSHIERGSSCNDPHPCSQAWNFINADADETLEIIDTDRRLDFWGCARKRTVIYDWDADIGRYIVANDWFSIGYSEACVFGDAVLSGYDETNIPVYERWLASYPDVDFPIWSREEVAQYVKARLIISYALTGRSSDAVDLIAELSQEAPQSDMMSDFVNALIESDYVNTRNKNKLCSTVYSTFVPYAEFGGASTEILFSKVDIRFVDSGFTWTGNTPWTQDICPLSNVVDEALSESEFSSSESLIEQLKTRDLPVAKSFHADINDDGSDEWFVWLDMPVDAVAFISDSEGYQVTRLDSPPPFYNEGTVDIAVYDLPYNAGKSLAVLVNNRVLCSEFRNLEGEGRWLWLWRIEETSLIPVVKFPVCEDYELHDLLPVEEATQIDGWVYTDGYEPVTFSWDANTMSYISPSRSTPLRDWEKRSNFTELVAEASDAFQHHAFLSSFKKLTEALRNPPFDLPGSLGEARYYRALALEALNRPDEALAEYIAIYEAAPESAWGMLAALHLQPVGEQG